VCYLACLRPLQTSNPTLCELPLQTFMRRNSVYFGVIIGGAFIGERVRARSHLATDRRPPLSLFPLCWLSSKLHNFGDLFLALQAVHSVFDSLWESNNKGVSWSGAGLARCIQQHGLLCT
jgi:hypothetical protein